VANLRAELLVELERWPEARKAIATISPIPAPLLEKVEKGEKLASTRRADDVSIVAYDAMLERARQMRVDGDCSGALQLAKEAEGLSVNPGRAIWEESQDLSCSNTSSTANAMASKAFIAVAKEQPIQWRSNSVDTGVDYWSSSERAVTHRYVWSVGGDGYRPYPVQKYLAPERPGTKAIVGRFGVIVDDSERGNQGVTVWDIQTGRSLWNDRTEASAWSNGGFAAALLSRVGERDELVLVNNAGHFYRWNASTGRRLTGFALPVGWILRNPNSVVTTTGSSWFFAEFDRKDGNGGESRFFKYPSGQPLFPSGRCPAPSNMECAPGWDPNHLVIRQSMATGTEMWDFATRKAVGPYPSPSADASRVANIKDSFVRDEKQLFLLWTGGKEVFPGRSAEEHAGCSTVVAATQSADGHWRGEQHTFQPTTVALDYMEPSPDTKLIAGWSSTGIVFWDSTSGKLLVELPVDPFVSGKGCIDSEGNHFAIDAGGQILLVDLARRRVFPVSYLALKSELRCSVDGITQLATVSGKGQTVNRFDWEGRRIEGTVAPSGTAVSPLGQGSGKSKRGSSADGRRYSNGRELCENSVCSPLNTLPQAHNRLDELGYVLGGKALVLVWGSRAFFLSPDGQKVLGGIEYTGRQGWFFFDAPDPKNLATIAPDRRASLEGESRIEFVAGTASDAMLCVSGNFVFPWRFCSDWFDKVGAFAQFLASIR
jgi:hypothetical protein